MSRSAASRRLERLGRGIREIFGEKESDRILANDLVAEDLREMAHRCTDEEVETALAEAKEGEVRKWGWIAKRLLGGRSALRRKKTPA